VPRKLGAALIKPINSNKKNYEISKDIINRADGLSHQLNIHRGARIAVTSSIAGAQN
jgi:hypothetical protein